MAPGRRTTATTSWAGSRSCRRSSAGPPTPPSMATTRRGLSSITYPSGRVVQQSYDAIGRLCAIAATTSACTSYTTPYATGFGYNTAFETTGFNYGNGVTAAFGYSADRLQLTSLRYVRG